MDHQAARIVLNYLDASDQGAAALDIESYLGLGDCWNGPPPEPGAPASSNEGIVPDSITWGCALLDLIRSLPPVQAAFIGVVAVSPPWWEDAQSMPLGKIANMLEVAEAGMLDRDEETDWGWFRPERTAGTPASDAEQPRRTATVPDD